MRFLFKVVLLLLLSIRVYYYVDRDLYSVKLNISLVDVSNNNDNLTTYNINDFTQLTELEYI